MSKRKITGLIFTIFVISLALLQLKKEYKPFELSIQSDKKFVDQDKPYLRVFNTQDKSKFQDYYLLNEPFILSVLDQPIWGFCLLKNDKGVVLNHNNKKINFKKSNSEKCFYTSKIKKYNKAFSSKVTHIGKLFAALFLSFIFAVVMGLIASNQGLRRKDIYFLLSAGFIIVLYMLFSYPGLYDTDTILLFNDTKEHYIGSWFTVIYSFLFYSQIQAFDSVFIIPLFVNLFALISLHFYRNFLKYLSFDKLSFYYPLLIIMLPSVGFYLNLISRDVYSCLIHIFLALSIPYYYLKDYKLAEKKASYLDYCLVILASLAFSIREESFLVVLAYLLVFLFVSKVIKRGKITIIATFLLSQLFFYSITLVFTTSENKTREVKAIVSLSHIISSIIKEDYKTESKNNDKKIINKYYDYTKLINYHRDNDVHHINMGARKELKSKDLSELYKLTFKLITDNFSTFMKSRIKMMYHLFWVNGNSILLPRDILIFRIFDLLLIKSNENNFIKYEKMNSFQKLGVEIQYLYNQNSFFYILYNGIPSMIMLLLTLILFKVLPISALSSLIILSRLPVFFFFTPAAQFKYTFDIFIFGWLLLPFIIWEWRSRKSNYFVQNLSFLKALRRKSIK